MLYREKIVSLNAHKTYKFTVWQNVELLNIILVVNIVATIL
jgi:hypothetical protein